MSFSKDSKFSQDTAESYGFLREKDKIETKTIEKIQNHLNTLYTVSVDFSGQFIDSIMDTGTQSVIVNSNLCQSPGCQENLGVTASKHGSQTTGEIEILNGKWSIKFGRGVVSCQLGQGSVSVGEIEVENQELCLVTDDDKIFTQVSF